MPAAAPGESPSTSSLGVPTGMNKQELIGSVAEATGLNRTDAGKAVESVFDTISGALKRGDEVRLVGFGTFSVTKRKASTGRNPRTGEPRSEEHTSELQSLMRNSYAVFCLK